MLSDYNELNGILISDNIITFVYSKCILYNLLIQNYLMRNIVLAKLVPHLIAIISFIAVSVFYFYPQFEGRIIKSGDLDSFEGMAQEARAFKKETGENTLWTNSMFGGMPTYQTTAPQKNNVFRSILIASSLGFSRPAGYFIYGCLSAYVMLLIFGVNPWLSLFGAIGFSFMTNHMVLYEAGHTSKILAIMSSPIIVAGLWALFRERLIVGGIVFTLGLGLNISANHYQMTYYLAILLAIYFIMEVVAKLKQGKARQLANIVGICVLSSAIGVGASASKFLPTYEYSKETMRGTPILKSTGAPSSSSETEGLEFQYAMNWSNGFLDLFSSFIPGVAGGGSGEKISSDAAFAKEVRKLGSATDRAPMYWGGLPSTSGPVYFGAVFFFLMLFGSFALKGPLKWWVLVAVLLTLLLSMGKNFELISGLFFHYFPFYNKFRTPNSILSVTAVLIPILGLISLSQLLRSDYRELYLKPLIHSTGIMAAISLFFAVVGPGFFDFSAPVDANYANVGLDKALVADRKSLMRSDSIRTLILVLLMAGGIFAFIRDKITASVIIGLFAVLILFDQIGVSKRYLDHKSFVSGTQKLSSYQPRPVDTQILNDKDPYFRVFDQTIDPFNSSRSSYFHKTVGGYHAAKLQRIQDLIDRHISKGNQRVLNMLNTKYYIINDDNNQATARLNTAALGNAWYVNNIDIVNNANEEIDALSSFDPAGDAIVHREYADYVSGLKLNKNGSITLLDYAPNNLSYESNTQGDQFAVFSEMWYGPNKGWQAYIDGEPVEHIRVNYALRGMKVPSGQHRISFIFDPAIYHIGSVISLLSSIVFVLLVLAGLWLLYRKRGILFSSQADPSLTSDLTQGIIKATSTSPLVATKSKKGITKTKKKNRKRPK